MRPLNLIYIENDAVLRKMLSEALAKAPQINLLLSAGSAEQAMDQKLVAGADVALIDFNLSPRGVNGVELGLMLRQFNQHIGIAIYSQFPMVDFIQRVPPEIRSGWSFFDKSAEMEISDYLDILAKTAAGKGNWQDFDVQADSANANDVDGYFALTARQRNILMLAAEGLTTKVIASQMGISYEYARKELSRAYAALVPVPGPGVSHKAAAIAKYLQIMRLG